MAAQAAGYVFFGTGDLGRGISGLLSAAQNVIAIIGACLAFRRARGIDALFWFLFTVALLILLLPITVLSFEMLLQRDLISDPLANLIYCLYGAPIIMMLFLPDSHPHSRLDWEVFLDLFQVVVVVSLIYSTFFFVPLHKMALPEAALHVVTVSNLHTFFLLVVTFVRLQFARTSAARSALLRLTLFLFACTIATFIGNWLDQHHYATALAWFDLGWDIPEIVAAFIAFTWVPSDEAQSGAVLEAASFLVFLRRNLLLVVLLTIMHSLSDRWSAANGYLVMTIALAAYLVAFTFRLVLTQYHQQVEISQRQIAQGQLAVANDRVRALLDDARRQTQEITQVSELGSLLQSCTSQKEAFRLVPERLRRILPDASGCISVLSPSKSRVESVAEWGPGPPADQIFTPGECWALRRGSTHAHGGGPSALKCPHLLGDGPSICIPLIANGDAVGVLALQENTLPTSADDVPRSSAVAWRRQLALSAAEHIAVAIANLNLRDALRLQAVRDSLTGLYNRRYMEEFLEHELRRAQRRHRPLAVMMLDLDHFKRYNDTFGHAVGDQTLAAVGETLLRSVRAEDVVCRYGGEEFVIVLPECSLRQAVTRADDIRLRLRDYCLQSDGQPRDPITVTVSIGVAAFDETDETTDRPNLLLKLADDALYQAKRTGRNCVIAAKPAASAPEDTASTLPPEKSKSASSPAT
jgi:diguanylate cyclase (GGDEF)-like protein